MVDIVHDSHAEDDIVVQEQNDQILLLTEQDLIMDSDHHPQVMGDVDADSEFRKEFHKLVLNVYIGPEIFEQRWHDLISNSRSEGSVEYCVIQYMDKENNNVYHATVARNKLDSAINCSCGHYNRHGYLCRHVFCVFGIHGTENIPQNYISPRWRKNALPAHLREKRHRYGPCIEETEILASKLTSTLEDTIELIRNDPEKLSALLTKIEELKKETEADIPPQVEPQNKDALYEDLLGVKRPDVIDIENPLMCNTKGNRKGHSRIVSESEKGKNKTKVRINRKVPFKHHDH
ncbi:FAR1 DNA binding domain-containing protein [Artemisia annua]|uniref:FAR1 DNA binding domain-containing protein n=1 Tax=Artemisia annua TaxID=35608 RepID=A0A2U1LQE5_ARTAN|nr:FAR1 DNA binding domain-containing protein [Artemisia annua]